MKRILFVFAIFFLLSFVSAQTFISSCQNIVSPGDYELNQAISSTGTCISINSSNVNLNCAGNTITYGTGGTSNSIGINAIHATAAQTNLTIKNCVIVKNSGAGSGGNGIMLTRFANSTILNNTIRTNGTSGNKGIYVLTASDRVNVSRNNIITSGSSTTNYGVYLSTGSADSIIEFNNITTGKGNANSDNYGIYVADPRASISDNYVYTFGSGDSNFGIYSSTSTTTNILRNTIYTSGSGNNRGIYLSSSDLNFVANNTINTSGQASVGVYISSSGSVNVLRNEINSSADSVYITSSTLSDFTSVNISRDNRRMGRNITVYGGGGANLPCPNNAIIDNPSDGGLKFIGCNNITVQNWNRPTMDTDSLFFVNSDNNKIVNNTINGGIDGLTMVFSSATCDNNLIANNTFTSYAFIDGYAIRVVGANNSIVGNNLTTRGLTSGNTGISIGNDFNNVTNNFISTGGTSGNTGINLEAFADNSLVQNNIIYTSGTSGNTGIYLGSTNVNNSILDNNITASGTTSGNLGIRLLTNSNYNILRSNTIYTKGLTSGNNGIDLSSSSNNLISLNNVYAGYGSGTSDNDGFSIVSSRNNTFANNIIFANGTATSITSSSIFLQSNSVNNTFVNNSIIKSVGNAIEIDFSTTYPSGNIFQNNSLSNVGGSDLFFMDANINGTTFIDQPIGKYNFTGLGGTIIFENSQFGKLSFNSAVNGSGNNLTSDIQIKYNFIQIDSARAGLNRNSNVYLYNLSTNFYLPFIKKDGLYECNSTTSPACVNLTDLNSGNVSFSVSSWSNYSISSSPDLISPVVNIIYPLNQNYSTNVSTLNFSASDNIALDMCWYSANNGITNTTIACGANISMVSSEGVNSWKVWVNDSSGNVNSASVTFFKDTNAPLISIISPANTTYAVNNIFLNYTTSDISAVKCSYSFDESPIITLPGCATANISGLNDGAHIINVYVNDSLGNINYSSVYFMILSAPPLWSNMQSAVPSEYSQNKSFFNITWSSLNTISTVLLESNFSGVATNYTMNSAGGGLYVFNLTMPAGTFYWKSYAIDSFGNSNVSNIEIVSMNKTGNPVQIIINGDVNIDKTISYGTISNVSARASSGSPTLIRDGQSVSNPEVRILGANAGGYNYSVSVPESQNYSSNSTSSLLFVTKGTSSVNLYLNGNEQDTTIIYGNTINATAKGYNGTVVLYRDGAPVGSSEILVLKSGVYNYTATIVENENISASVKSLILNVTKAQPATQLLLNGIAGNINVIYGNYLNASASENNIGDEDVTYDLVRDSLIIQTGSSLSNYSLLGVGNYTYQYISSGGENYTDSIKEFNVSVTKANPTIRLLVNNLDSDISTVVGTQIEINASSQNPAGETISLYEDGNLIDSGSNVHLLLNYSTPGERVIEASIGETPNFNSGSKSHTIQIIDSDAPQYSNLREVPPDPASYTLNGKSHFNITWTDNVGIDEVIFVFDGNNYSLSAGQIEKNGDDYHIGIKGVSAGLHTYRWYANDTSNTWTITPQQSYTIEKAIAALFLTTSPGNSVMYGVETLVFCSANNLESSPLLTRNIEVVNNPDSSILKAGVYNYACTSSSTQNYTSASTTGTLTINQATPIISLKLNNVESDVSIYNGTEVNMSATINTLSPGFLNLTFDGREIASGYSPLENSSIIYSEGSHEVQVSYYGNENYSSSSKRFSVNVQLTHNEEESRGSSGGGGGSGGGAPIQTNVTKPVQNGIDIISGVEDVIAYPGETKTLGVSLRNSGNTFLNKCKIVGKGSYSSWVKSSDSKNLNSGEIGEFLFSIEVPKDAKTEDQPSLSMTCLEGSFNIPLSMKILKTGLSVDITSMYLTEARKLLINYTIDGTTDGKEELIVRASDSDNNVIDKVNQEVEFTKGEKSFYSTILDISNASDGMIKVSVLRNDEQKTNLVDEFFAYNSKSISGFVLLEGENRTRGYIAMIVFISIVIGFFLVRKILHYRKMDNIHNSFMPPHMR